jgi:hypothetical protein
MIALMFIHSPVPSFVAALSAEEKSSVTGASCEVAAGMATQAALGPSCL